MANVQHLHPLRSWYPHKARGIWIFGIHRGHWSNLLSFIKLSSVSRNLNIISLMGAGAAEVGQNRDGFYSLTDAEGFASTGFDMWVKMHIFSIVCRHAAGRGKFKRNNDRSLKKIIIFIYFHKFASYFVRIPMNWFGRESKVWLPKLLALASVMKHTLN
jgi:hypothetical protein